MPEQRAVVRAARRQRLVDGRQQTRMGQLHRQTQGLDHRALVAGRGEAAGLGQKPVERAVQPGGRDRAPEPIEMVRGEPQPETRVARQAVPRSELRRRSAAARRRLPAAQKAPPLAPPQIVEDLLGGAPAAAPGAGGRRGGGAETGQRVPLVAQLAPALRRIVQTAGADGGGPLERPQAKGDGARRRQPGRPLAGRDGQHRDAPHPADQQAHGQPHGGPGEAALQAAMRAAIRAAHRDRAASSPAAPAIRARSRSRLSSAAGPRYMATMVPAPSSTRV